MMNNILFRAFFLGMLYFLGHLTHAQTRSGSINLASSEARKLYFSNEYSSMVGIEGSDFTIEAWVKMASNNDNDFTLFRLQTRDKSANDWHRLALSHGGDGEEDWHVSADRALRQSDNGNIGKDKDWKLYSNQSGFSMPNFSLGEWHHIAFVKWNGNAIRIYVDGQLSTAYSLTSSGNSLELFPNGSDGQSNMSGYCYIGGGGASSSNDEGKFYVGEVRVWNDNLSASTISNYYNREVNSDHPNWNNLIRYYHGTESSGSGTSRKFEDRSPNSEFDGWIDNSDVTVATGTGFSPPVAPPEVDGSSYDGFSAADCDEGEVALSWSNMHSNGYSRYDVGYKIVRESDNSTLYDNFSTNKTSFTDNSISEGVSTTYRLYTYYEVDGTKYYSSDYETNAGSRKEDFNDPSSFSASTNQCDKSIDLSWGTDLPPGLRIQYSNNGSSYSTLASLDGDETSYTATNMNTDQDVYFRIYNRGTDKAGCSVEENYVTTTGKTSTEPAAPTGLSISADNAAQEITVGWSNPSGNNATSWTVKRTDADGNITENSISNLATTSYTDNSVAQCVTYDYAIAAENACGTTYSTTSVNETVGTDLSTAITSLSASKGYYADNVFLEWSSDNLAAIDRFRIYRSKADANNYSLIKVLENDLTYSDETALGGNIYNYKIQGEASCNSQTVYTGALYDEGFILPYGIANGHVEYEGGNAVEDVDITVNRSNGTSGYSLSLQEGSYVEVEDHNIQMGGASWTFECWLKSANQDTIAPIFAMMDNNNSWDNGERRIYFDHLNYFGLACSGDNNYRVAGAEAIRDGQWHHVAMSYDHGTKKNAIYFDGVEQTNTVQTGHDGSRSDNNDNRIYFGKQHESGAESYEGNLDEIRFWSYARSQEEIQENMNRYLSGNEDGLGFYFRCDEGMGTGLYDASRENENWNANHGEFVGADLYFSDDIPSSDQLAIKGSTDEYGDYTISYIPYSGSGETFRVTPSKGQHVFEPNSRTIYIGNGAQTQNNLDFTDISSFNITGKVTYENSNVPVVDAIIKVDGEYGRDETGGIVRTDANGDYSVAVPIGYHYLSVEKDGHYFSEGYYPPLNEYGDIETFEVVEDNIVNFTDSTYVIVAGRVVGGKVEGDKSLGFGKSVNNVGDVTLNFDLQNEAWAYPTQSVVVNDTTGEFEIHLIPEVFNVQDFTTSGGYAMVELPSIDFSSSFDDITDTDSTYSYSYYNNGTVKDSTLIISEYIYNHDLRYVFTESPVLSVFETGHDGLVGDTVIYFTDQETGEKDTVNFGSQSILDFPVYQMGQSYDLNVSVFELYFNPDHPTGPLYDSVYVSDAEVVLVNGLKAGGGSEVGTTDNNGLYQTTFLAGLPNISQDGDNSYTQTIEVYTQVGGQIYYWSGDGTNISRAYVLGAYPLAGTDFITYGPEVPEVILRDPPGSNSYAYIEKGSSFSTSKTYGMNSTSNNSLDYTFHSGIYSLIGLGAIVETDFQLDNTYGLTLSKEYTTTGEYVETVTFNDRIETSSDPEDVGSDADLYIGKAYNAYVSQTKSLKPMRRAFAEANAVPYAGGSGNADDDIVLGLIDGFAINDDSASTYFMYSQKHIVEELIPDLIVLRNNLFLKPEYTSNLPTSHRYYGLPNNSPAMAEFKLDTIAQNSAVDTTQLSYTFTQAYENQIDSLEMLNQQIDIWLSTILINEIEKAEAVTEKNIAIDGSSGIYSSSVKQAYNASYNYARTNSIGYYTEAAMGLTTSGKGFTLSTASDGMYNFSTSEGNTRENAVEFGYIIDERDEGDYYSIDVKYDEGVKYTSFDDINKSVKNVSLDDYELVKGILAGGSAVAAFGYSTAVWQKLSTAVVDKAAKGNAIAASITFGVGAAVHLLDMASLAPYALNVSNSVSNLNEYKINDFAISSPVFSIKGGQSKCPYEGDEFTTVYTDNSGDYFRLHTGTLQREVPVIDVEPSIRTEVPETQAATFTLKLKNESASNSDAWYEIEILDGTNPNGLALEIDGQTAERAFFVEAFETLEKTLTARKTLSTVNEYDSVGIVFKSTCQYNPADLQEDIGDTVYISVHFLPECSAVDIKNGQDGWVINFDDNNESAITLEGYDINASTLASISFQYKTTSGSPVTVKQFFVDTLTTDYENYTGEKDILDASTKTVLWDLNSLSDREYQIRAKSTCLDGSVYESDYYTGVVDRITPTVFGTPQPTDGVYQPGDDISIKFNEELEIGLIKDFNFSVKSILNGADVAHGTSVYFNGTNQYASIPSVSLNDKSFAIEFWLQRDAGDAGTAFAKGENTETLSLRFNEDESMTVQLGVNSFDFDPSPIYTTVYPIHSWHHYAVVYDQENHRLRVIGDDQLLLEENNVIFNNSAVEALFIATNTASNDFLEAKVHEFRIWEDARATDEILANMGITLNGSELGLYGYWPMDDGNGSLVLDQAAGRNMSLNAQWENYPGSDALDFDGSQQYLTLDGTNLAINSETDFTVEFWYNTAVPSTTSTLFSTGKGDLTDTLASTEYAISISSTPAGEWEVLSNGNSFSTLNASSTMNNTWHHFALVVDRDGSSKIYLDGELNTSSTTAGIAGLAGADVYLGARGYAVDDFANNNLAIDQYFDGAIDEFRIWNSARNADYINTYKSTKLSGDEPGIQVYLPFEIYEEVQGSIMRNESLSDEALPTYGTQASPAVASTTANFVTGASITDVRPVQDINFSYVVNTDEIVITPLTDAYRLEGQTLEISVSGMNDLNGNTQLSTASWTAFVQRNELVWEEGIVNIEHENGEQSSFQATIVNLGGTSYDYSLEGIPNWLSVSESAGTVEPNSTKTLNFSISAGLGIGQYEQSINLATYLGFDESLKLNVSSTVPAPDWTVNASDFQYGMSVFGQLSIQGEFSTDVNDQVAAYVGSQLRGVANVQYVAALDEYRVFLTIYSNVTSGEDINFVVWDASEGILREDVTPELSFETNKIVGTASNPQLIEASDKQTLTIELSPGWNWISVNIDDVDLDTVDAVMSSGIEGDLFRSQSTYDIYDPLTGWYGGVTAGGGILHEEMYQVYVQNGGRLSTKGEAIDPTTTPINITTGWNYVGFTPQEAMPLDEALAGFNPSSGDIIKGQFSFAIYDVILGWIGSLSMLSPTEGYMLKNEGVSRSFTYPAFSSLSTLRTYNFEREIVFPSNLKMSTTSYANNMSVIAKFADTYQAKEDDILLVMDGDSIIGYAEAILVNDEQYYFLTLSDEPSAKSQVYVYNTESQEILRTQNQLSFEANKVLGDLENPYLISLGENTATAINLYPNPVSQWLNVEVACEDAQVEILNDQGMLVKGFALEGTSVDLSDLAQGLYIVNIKTTCGNLTQKISKINQ